MKEKVWIPEFIEAVQNSIGAMDLGTLQPFGWLEFEPLFAKEWIEWIKQLINQAAKKGIKPKELAYLWPTAAGLRCPLYFTLLNMKCAHTPKEDRLKIAQFFFDMIKERAVEDVYGSKSNICQTKKEIKQLFKKYKFEKGTPETAKLLAKLYNAAYNLCCGLYLDFYLDYCAENEGPYDVSDIFGPGHILIIKKFVGMQIPIWRGMKIPYNNLYLYTVYKNVTFRCDMISVHSVYEGDIINNLIAYAVVADGKILHKDEELTSLLDQLSTLSVEQWQLLKSLDLEEQKQKGLLSKCFGMKRLFDHIGIDWKPTKAMKEAVKGKPLKDNFYWQIPKENKKDYWNKIYDPEIDFYPAGSML